MKKALKIILIILASVFISFLGFFIYFSILTKDIKLDVNKLINVDRSIQYFDKNGNLFFEESNGLSIVEFENIPKHTINAFIAIEDKRFYQHNGIDIKGLIRATVNNIKSFSFKEGASTISQQLIKNTHLSSDKTLKRKLSEIKLSLELERKFTKKEIIEKYLNTIYFGDNCYGIASATQHYFNKNVSDLDLNESAMLAGIIKAPSYYSPILNQDKCNERKNIVLTQMFSQGYIDNSTYNSYKNKDINIFLEKQTPNEYTYSTLVKNELNKIIQKSPYKNQHLRVFTEFDANAQTLIKENINDDKINCEKTAVLINKNGFIKAYYSTCGNIKRQVGSVIKPILVYAPAIENDVVNQATRLLDEKTDFNGYSPSNYNDKYYGYLSVKDSLAKSSNVCAVKILNYTGIERSLSYLNKTAVKLDKSDNSLCIALGSLKNGVDLISLTSSYGVFNNNGNYIEFKCINKVTNDKNKIIYNQRPKTINVFSDDTVSIINDMLLNTVKKGTAKKLSFIPFPVYAKTGTVGFENGNTDAYTISYTATDTLGVWYGNKNDVLLNNNLTGGSNPAVISSNIWESLYNKNNIPTEIEKSSNVDYFEIDKLTYEDSGKIVLADSITPERYKIKVLLKKSKVTKEISNRFSVPKIEKYNLSVNNYENKIELCLTEYCNALIYKEQNDKRTLVFDSKNDGKIYIDKKIKTNDLYRYIIIPYYSDGIKNYYGQEIFTRKIKSPKIDVGDHWWNNDLN